MKGKIIDGYYCRTNIILKYAKYGCLGVAASFLLIILLGLFTGNNWIISGSLVMVAIATLGFIITSKFAISSPKECSFKIDSIKNSMMNITITMKDTGEVIKVISATGTWDRDTFEMILIDGDGGRLEFTADKNDFKLLKQDNVDVNLVKNKG